MTCWIAWTAGSVFGAATGPIRGTDGTVVGAAAATGGGLLVGLKLVVTKRSTAKPMSALKRATPTSEAATLHLREVRTGRAAGGGGDCSLSGGRQSEGLLGNMGVLWTPLF